MFDERSINCIQNLLTVLWANRSIVHTLTSFIPYYIYCGIELVLCIELEIPTWQILPWKEIDSTTNLLALHVRPLQQ